MPKAREYFFSVSTLAQDVVDFFQMREVAFGEAFLVRNQQIGMCRAKPPRENALEENVNIEARCAWEESLQWRNSSTVGDREIKAACCERIVDKIHVAVEPDAIGAGDDVNFFWHCKWGRDTINRKLYEISGWLVLNCPFADQICDTALTIQC